MTMASREDWEPAVAALHEAVDTGRDVVDVDLLGNLGNAALNLGDDQAARHYYTVMLSSSRESGAGMAVVYALQRLAFTQLLAGRWTDLRASAEEALTLSHSVGQRALAATPLAWLTLLAALQGRADYDQLLQRSRRRGRQPPAGHPHRSHPRPDPVGDGDTRRSRRPAGRRRSITSVGCGCRP